MTQRGEKHLTFAVKRRRIPNGLRSFSPTARYIHVVHWLDGLEDQRYSISSVVITTEESPGLKKKERRAKIFKLNDEEEVGKRFGKAKKENSGGKDVREKRLFDWQVTKRFH